MIRQAAVRMNGRFASVETGVRSNSAGKEDMEGADADDMKLTRFDVAKVLFRGNKSLVGRHTQGTRRSTVCIKSETDCYDPLCRRALLHTFVFRPRKVCTDNNG